jgi:hypothetical protein
MNEDKDLLEGFNAGYIIEKHRPALSQELQKAVEGVELPFVEGFVAGAEEYSIERNKLKAIEILKDHSKSSIPDFLKKGKSIEDKDRTIDDRDLER